MNRLVPDCERAPLLLVLVKNLPTSQSERAQEELTRLIGELEATMGTVELPGEREKCYTPADSEL